MATSDPPQRVNNTQPLGAETRQQSAGSPDQERESQAKRKRGGRQNQSRQKSIQRGTNNRNREDRQAQADESPDQGNHQRFRQHKKENKAVCESNRFEHRQFAGAFANGYGHGIARDKQQSEKDHSADGQDQELDVPQLLCKPCLERRFGFCFGFRGGVCKPRVDSFGDSHGIVRTVEFQDVPTDHALDDRRNIFVKIFPLQPELALVSARMFVRVNAVYVELPGLGGAIKSVFQGNTIANLPAKALRECCADDGALTVIYKDFPLIIGNTHLGHDLPLIFNINDELWEEVLFILINAAEPVVVRDRLDAGDLKNFVAIRERNSLNEARAVDNYEPVSTRQFGAAAERSLDHRQEREKEQGHRKG